MKSLSRIFLRSVFILLASISFTFSQETMKEVSPEIDGIKVKGSIEEKLKELVPDETSVKGIIESMSFSVDQLQKVKKHILYRFTYNNKDYAILINKSGEVRVCSEDEFNDLIVDASVIDSIHTHQKIYDLLDSKYIDPSGLLIFNYQKDNPNQKILFLQADLHSIPFIQSPTFKAFLPILSNDKNNVLIFREGLPDGEILKIKDDKFKQIGQIDNALHADFSWVDYTKLRYPNIKVIGVSDPKLYPQFGEILRKLYVYNKKEYFSDFWNLADRRDTPLVKNSLKYLRNSKKQYGILNMGAAHLFKYNNRIENNKEVSEVQYGLIKDTILTLIKKNPDICFVAFRSYGYQFQKRYRIGHDFSKKYNPPPDNEIFSYKGFSNPKGSLSARTKQDCVIIYNLYINSSINSQLIANGLLTNEMPNNLLLPNCVISDCIKIGNTLLGEYIKHGVSYEKGIKDDLFKKTKEMNQLPDEDLIFEEGYLVLNLSDKIYNAETTPEGFTYYKTKKIIGDDLYVLKMPLYMNLFVPGTVAINDKTCVLIGGTKDNLARIKSHSDDISQIINEIAKKSFPINGGKVDIDLNKIDLYFPLYEISNGSILYCLKNSTNFKEAFENILQEYNKINFAALGITEVKMIGMGETTHIKGGVLYINPNFPIHDLQHLKKEYLSDNSYSEKTIADTITLEKYPLSNMEHPDFGKIFIYSSNEKQLRDTQRKINIQLLKEKTGIDLIIELFRYYVINLNKMDKILLKNIC